MCCGVLLILCNFTLHGYYLNDVLFASAIAGGELIGGLVLCFNGYRIARKTETGSSGCTFFHTFVTVVKYDKELQYTQN